MKINVMGGMKNEEGEQKRKEVRKDSWQVGKSFHSAGH